MLWVFAVSAFHKNRNSISYLVTRYTTYGSPEGSYVKHAVDNRATINILFLVGKGGPQDVTFNAVMSGDLDGHSISPPRRKHLSG
jgi:hypothetical protein